MDFSILGYLYISLSAVLFCLMTIFVKLSGQNIGTFQIIFFRGLFTLLITFLIIKKKKKYLWGYNKKVLILRGVVGTLALLFVYESIQRFSLSEATVIQYLYPIFTVIFASIFLNERSSFKSYIAVAFGFLGVYSVLNYPFMSYDESLQYLDVLFALLGAIFYSFSLCPCSPLFKVKRITICYNDLFSFIYSPFKSSIYTFKLVHTYIY
ncbi:DMT family transporter [Candidatus Marinimicrobia bacterium]|nr:DMT family transporter [Candidatus Neomarinimicrobiota bacterium]